MTPQQIAAQQALAAADVEFFQDDLPSDGLGFFVLGDNGFVEMAADGFLLIS